MRTSSKLSSFAIAALVIGTAATTGFAQAQAEASANETRVAVETSAGTRVGELALAVNAKRLVAGEGLTGEPAAVKSAGEMRNVTRTPALSLAAFSTANQSSQFTKIDANKFLNQQFTQAIANVNITDSSQPSDNSGKKIEFVPSRGQKLPDSKY